MLDNGNKPTMCINGDFFVWTFLDINYLSDEDLSKKTEPAGVRHLVKTSPPLTPTKTSTSDTLLLISGKNASQMEKKECGGHHALFSKANCE